MSEQESVFNVVTTASYGGVGDGESLTVSVAENEVTFTLKGQSITLEKWRAMKVAALIEDK